MKNNKLIIFLIIVLSILALSLISLIGYLIITKSTVNFNFDDKTELIYEKNYLNEEINDIVIKSISSDIIFKESIDNEIKVTIYGDKSDNLKVNLENNILSIDYDIKNNFCIGICSLDDKIIINIPLTYDKEININTTSGDIKGIDLTNANLTLSSTSGDIKINNINKSNIKTTSGDVNINKTTNTTIKTTSGDVEIKDVTEKLNVKTTSGDVEIDNLILKEDSKINTTSGDVEIDKINNIYVDTTTKSGRVDIKNNDRKADYELKIETTSGDISVIDY